MESHSLHYPVEARLEHPEKPEVGTITVLLFSHGRRVGGLSGIMPPYIIHKAELRLTREHMAYRTH